MFAHFQCKFFFLNEKSNLFASFQLNILYLNLELFIAEYWQNDLFSHTHENIKILFRVVCAIMPTNSNAMKSNAYAVSIINQTNELF